MHSDNADNDNIGNSRADNESMRAACDCFTAVICAKKLDKIETFGKSMALHYYDCADTAVVNVAEL